MMINKEKLIKHLEGVKRDTENSFHADKAKWGLTYVERIVNGLWPITNTIDSIIEVIEEFE